LKARGQLGYRLRLVGGGCVGGVELEIGHQLSMPVPLAEPGGLEGSSPVGEGLHPNHFAGVAVHQPGGLLGVELHAAAPPPRLARPEHEDPVVTKIDERAAVIGIHSASESRSSKRSGVPSVKVR
jgi:hypothetical protein